MKFSVEKEAGSARAGKIETEHGVIHTPAFIPVATKATVKALVPEQVAATHSEAVLANTYHLYLAPGDEVVKSAGGLHKFMNWSRPTFTDSGGFQAFSLGAGFDRDVSKVAKRGNEKAEAEPSKDRMAKIDEDGVDFKSIIDGSWHRFTPEKSMEIQHNIGADFIFAFDECPSPHASYEYQREAMERTHRWAERSIKRHKELQSSGNGSNQSLQQSLFGIVQGGRYKDLRTESAKIIGSMDFDGYGIGGSFDKEDMSNAVSWVTSGLPKGKPRHLLGIGEPIDILLAIENGIDTFDCVLPTRLGRNGGIYTARGKINILNAKFTKDFSPIEEGCECYTCKNYSRAYVAHLFRSKEMLAATLASIHNIYFIQKITREAREAIKDGIFIKFKDDFIKGYSQL